MLKPSEKFIKLTREILTFYENGMDEINFLNITEKKFEGNSRAEMQKLIVQMEVDNIIEVRTETKKLLFLKE